MSARATSWLAWSVCATALTLFGSSLLLVFLGWTTPLPKGWVSWHGQIITIVGFIGAPYSGASSPRDVPRTSTGGCGSAWV
jgi:hypothetical protein